MGQTEFVLYRIRKIKINDYLNAIVLIAQHQNDLKQSLSTPYWKKHFCIGRRGKQKRPSIESLPLERKVVHNNHHI
jgi:hypothetical protein